MRCKFRDGVLSGIGMVNSAAWQDSSRITMNTSLAYVILYMQDDNEGVIS